MNITKVFPPNPRVSPARRALPTFLAGSIGVVLAFWIAIIMLFPSSASAADDPKPPVANFTANPTEGTAKLIVEFTDTSIPGT